MKQWILLLVVTIFFVAGVFFCVPTTIEEYENEPIKLFQNKIANFHSAFSMNKEFYGNTEKTVLSNVSEEKIYGGIVSHHSLLAEKIARFFSVFKTQQPKTIVIIGPNHSNIGKGDILISKYPYQTPWGFVYPEEKYINELLSRKTAFNDETPFSREHSISSLVGFIKYYLPNVKIIPVVMKWGVTKERAELLANNLNEILPDDAVVIASVDFSHHLNKISANFHDEKSISAIQNFYYEGVLSSEIDSPSSIYALLKYLELKGAQKVLYENTNSADFMDNKYLDDVTSYFFAHFTKGKDQKDKKISVLSFGDMMFARNVEKSMKNGTNPFEKIRGVEGNFLRGVDFISANLEGPITESEDCVKKAYSFKFDPNIGDLIAESGINIVNLANNHTDDCKGKGIVDTKNYLFRNNIDFFGDSSIKNSYIKKEIDGKKIIFIGVDITIHSADLTKYYELIEKLKKENDYLVVNIHWGYEYHDNPSQIQKNIAHSLIDSGADLIIGHHPHIIQPMEVYKNKAIFYSLGNFIFDQIGEDTNNGFGVGTVFSEENVQFYLFPYNIKNYQPTLLLPEQANVFCKKYLSNAPNMNGCYFDMKSVNNLVGSHEIAN